MAPVSRGARAAGERRGSGRIWASGSVQSAAVHYGAPRGTPGGATTASASGGRRDLQVSSGGAGALGAPGLAPPMESRPHSAPNGSGLARDPGQRAGEASNISGIEARLGIVKKNRRSSLPAALGASDFAQDDHGDTRRLADTVGGRSSALQRNGSDAARREGRSGAPDSGGRTRARSAPSAALEERPQLAATAPPGGARSRPGSLAADALRRRGGSSSPRSELCPAALDAPDQGGAAVGLLGFAHPPSAKEWEGVDPLIEALFGEVVAGAAVSPSTGGNTLWSHMRQTGGGSCGTPQQQAAAAGGAAGSEESAEGVRRRWRALNA
eukprot:TRINITY_DN8959_c0_g2_i1.p1 TRINITY_DN8959_c0_g2~~TRINITY_DN8959_c0_g2_i1.p1  ORF type:complete len:351 (+),score=78.40 TRINITY_DN8959_c0_g2_i1:78-1055(+)